MPTLPQIPSIKYKIVWGFINVLFVFKAYHCGDVQSNYCVLRMVEGLPWWRSG